MIYKNNLSKLAMLLLAGTMTFVTGCSDDETSGNGEETKKQEKDGDGNDGSEDQDFEPVPGISIAELGKNKALVMSQVQTVHQTLNGKGTKTATDTADIASLEELINAIKLIKLDNKKVENNLDDALALLAIHVRFLNIIKDNKEDKTDTTKKTRADILAVAAKVIHDVKHEKKGGKEKKRDENKLFNTKKNKESESKTKFEVKEGTGKEVVDVLRHNTVFNVKIEGLKDTQTFTIDKNSFGGLVVAVKK